MSTLINQWTFPDVGHYYIDNGYQQTPNNGSDWWGQMFCTTEGLVGVYVKNDKNGNMQRRVSFYSPGFSGGPQAPLFEYVTASVWAAASYSFSHKAMIGLVNATDHAEFRKLDVKSGVESVLGSVNLTASLGIGTGNTSYVEAIAWDGTYLHVLRYDNGVVYVVDAAGTSNVVRTYSAPFGALTNSMQFDQNSTGSNLYIYFGGGANVSSYATKHVAKVAVGMSGANAEGTVVGDWKIPSFNDSAQTALYGRATNIAWDGRQICLNRRGNDTIYRYDLANDPSVIILSPNPARIPANGSTSRIVVQVVDDVGGSVPGALVSLAINNGTSNPVFGSILAPTTATTNSAGQATFTYQSGGASGTDYLQATVSY